MMSKSFMLIKRCLMLSLTCTAAEMTDINSVLPPPPGQDWVTSLHFFT